MRQLREMNGDQIAEEFGLPDGYFGPPTPLPPFLRMYARQLMGYMASSSKVVSVALHAGAPEESQ